MNEHSIKAFDFGIRIIELANYLEEEKKLFPLINRLLICGTGIGAYLRSSEALQKNREEQSVEACKNAAETEYLLELMVKTGYLTEQQSEPILSDCRAIKEDLIKQIDKKKQVKTARL